MSIIFLGSFVLLFLFFYAYFYEDRIYKVSKYCKPTENPKIKICKFSNGVYTGELKAFLRHGQGTYKFNSGESYSGGWQNNLRHGTAITITKEGIKTTDEWKKGKKKWIKNNHATTCKNRLGLGDEEIFLIYGWS